MTASERSGKAARRTAGTRGSARRPARPRVTPPVALTPAILREAALELLRLAVEYEQRHQPLAGSDVSDRKIRRTMHEVTDADAALRDVAEIIFRYRDDRRELVKQVRTAQAVDEIVSFVKERRKDWNAEQRRRQREGSPRKDPSHSADFKSQVAKRVQQCFANLEVHIDERLVQKIAEAAVLQPRSDKGLQERLLKVIADKVTHVKGRTIQGLLSALKGNTQRQGRIKDPEQAQRATFDEPVGGTDILEYVVRAIVARGHPEHVVDKVMGTWRAELNATLRLAGGSPASSVMPDELRPKP